MPPSKIVSWKTWLMAVAAFAVICLAGDAVFTEFIVMRPPISDAGRIRHLFLDQSEAIPIFGSSKAHGHYIPAEMGIPAFNYGMDSASFEVVDTLLEIELAKTRTTPVIVELEYWDTRTLGEKGRFIPFVSDPGIRRLLDHYGAMKWNYHVPGIRYFGYYDLFLRDYFNERMHLIKLNQGFREDVPPPEFDRAKLDKSIRERLASGITGYYPDAEKNRWLLAQITAHPRRLFFLIVSPYHRCFYDHFEHADQLAAWEKQLAELPNCRVIDCGHSDYPDELYLDTLHLRRVGAADYSRKIGARIRQAIADQGGAATSRKTEPAKP